MSSSGKEVTLLQGERETRLAREETCRHLTDRCSRFVAQVAAAIGKHDRTKRRLPQSIFAGAWGAMALEITTGGMALVREGKGRAAGIMVRPSAEAIWRSMWASQASAEELTKADTSSEEELERWRTAGTRRRHPVPMLDRVWVEEYRIAKWKHVVGKLLHKYAHAARETANDNALVAEVLAWQTRNASMVMLATGQERNEGSGLTESERKELDGAWEEVLTRGEAVLKEREGYEEHVNSEEGRRETARLVEAATGWKMSPNTRIETGRRGKGNARVEGDAGGEGEQSEKSEEEATGGTPRLFQGMATARQGRQKKYPLGPG